MSHVWLYAPLYPVMCCSGCPRILYTLRIDSHYQRHNGANVRDIAFVLTNLLGITADE